MTLHVKPGSRRNSIKLEENDPLEVSLTEPAENDRANRQLIQFLGKKLEVRRSSIKIVAGVRSRVKTILVVGLSGHEFIDRIIRERQIE